MKVNIENYKDHFMISDSNTTAAAAKIKAGQKDNKKKDSYFDGEAYRGYSVKTRLIRENTEQYKPVKIENAKSVYDMFKKLENLDQERFYNIVIDHNRNVIAVHLAFQGTLNESLVHPREIFKIALLCAGAEIILIHNHPSGTSEPSTKDFVITKRLVEAGNIIGIEILDHIIIGFGDYYSFSEKRVLKNL